MRPARLATSLASRLARRPEIRTSIPDVSRVTGGGPADPDVGARAERVAAFVWNASRQPPWASMTSAMMRYRPASGQHRYRDREAAGRRRGAELACCLTVHKTQGSEFGATFVVLTNPLLAPFPRTLVHGADRHQGPAGHPARGPDGRGCGRDGRVSRPRVFKLLIDCLIGCWYVYTYRTAIPT